MVVKVYCIHSTDKFINLQVNSIRKYVQNEVDVYVVNNSVNSVDDGKIIDRCTELKTFYIKVPANQLTSDDEYVRANYGIQWALNFAFHSSGLVVFIDSDMFFVQPINLVEYMGKNALYYAAQSRDGRKSMWSGIFLLNPLLLPDKRNFNIVEGCCDYLQKYEAAITSSELPHIPTNQYSVKDVEKLISEKKLSVELGNCLIRDSKFNNKKDYVFMELYLNNSLVRYRDIKYHRKSAERERVLNNFFRDSPVFLSIGSSCVPAEALNRQGYEVRGYPFNWNVTPYQALMKSFDDNFANFFNDLSLNRSIPAIINAYGMEFRHDFPIDKSSKSIVDDWDKYVDEFKSKYTRRIGRLRELLNSNKKVYFVRHSDMDDNQADDFVKLIEKLYPSLNFELILINGTNGKRGKINMFGIDNTIAWNDPEQWKSILNQF